MAAAAPKLRFVRCPKCLQLLVEYSSITVYQCGGCGTALRAKNRVGAVENIISESAEPSNSSNLSEGFPENNESICSEGQKIASSSNAQPSEKVVEEKISFTGENPDSAENVNEGKSSFMGENVDSPEASIESMPDEGPEANSYHDLIREVENVDTGENVNEEKSSFMVDENVGNQEATMESMPDEFSIGDENVSNPEAMMENMPDERSGASSNHDLMGEVESIMEQKDSFNNEDTNCQNIAADSKSDEVYEAKSNHVFIEDVERSQPYQGFRAESHEDLIEELERSLSFSDEEEDFVDVADSNGLHDALHSHMCSRRFSSGRKMNDGSQGDPHDRLIEELERSFSDAEESLDRHSVSLEEGIAEKVHGNGLDKDIHSLASRSANPYDGSMSPLEDGYDNGVDDQYLLESRQTFQQKEPAADDTKEKEEGHLEDDETANYVEAESGAVAVLSNLSNERFHSSLPSFDKRKEELSYRYRAKELHQGLSLDSEDFQSIQNFIESQMDGTSSSLSSGSPGQGDLVRKTSNKFKNFDRLERLKKMDELRDQLSRLSSRKGLEKRYQQRDLEHQSQLNSYKPSEQLPRSFDANSIPSSCTLEPYHDQGRPPTYPPLVPFSPYHSCMHCRFGHRQPHMLHNCSAMEYNSYYQSSYAGSTILDHESLSSSFKEQKRVVRKHILRPLSGASPFTICNSCFNLIQMPSDIYISKRKSSKLQCGQCSKVLMLSFPAMHRVDPKIGKEVAHQPNKAEDTIDARIEDASSHSAQCPRGDPVSINEEYGASFTRSFSSGAGPMLDVSRSNKQESESALHRLMGYDSASQLLRQSRVFDDGYESFESMVPVSNRVSKRKNS